MARDELPRPEFHRPVPIARLRGETLAVSVEASAAEGAAIAARLGIGAVLSLACDFTLYRATGGSGARGEIAADGALRARVVRDCVVTLDPFEAEVTDAFHVRFVRAGTETDDIDPDAPDEIPYHGDAIDLGEAAVEQLALVMDPWPRKPGAVVPEAFGAEVISPFPEPPFASPPFAALARRARES